MRRIHVSATPTSADCRGHSTNHHPQTCRTPRKPQRRGGQTMSSVQESRQGPLRQHAITTSEEPTGTAHEVIATRSGDWWTIEVTSGLPADVLGVSQARRLTEVHTVARNLIGDLLEVEPSDVDVTVVVQLPPELQRMVELYREAGIVEDVARTEAALARSRAASALLNAELTMRETAEVLGVSHQRIKQLVDRAPDDAGVDLMERIRTRVEGARSDRKAHTPVVSTPRVAALSQAPGDTSRPLAAG